MTKQTATQAILDGYIPSNILAKELGCMSQDFKHTTLDSVKFKNIILIKIPLSAVKFINSKEYTSTMFEAGESEESYDYVLPISKKYKVGFWR